MGQADGGYVAVAALDRFLPLALKKALAARK